MGAVVALDAIVLDAGAFDDVLALVAASGTGPQPASMQPAAMSATPRTANRSVIQFTFGDGLSMATRTPSSSISISEKLSCFTTSMPGSGSTA